MTTNRKRARWAAACVDLYADFAGSHLPEEAIADLIANLGHYAQRERLDFLKLVARAIGHWHLEQTDEDSIDVLPTVTILIGDEHQSNESTIP
jgi:hypothetical protein